ncbi:BA75_00727T0 [Komagataella pastoris]|uniref:BA75_00727T0 n=1 Tax=Komagataella pastoris TaxID=4922 RepID=A0A1B2J7L8_PICPA|nr:BA75_00727T0 [Komagataella pastoris]
MGQRRVRLDKYLQYGQIVNTLTLVGLFIFPIYSPFFKIVLALYVSQVSIVLFLYILIACFILSQPASEATPEKKLKNTAKMAFLHPLMACAQILYGNKKSVAFVALVLRKLSSLIASLYVSSADNLNNHLKFFSIYCVMEVLFTQMSCKLVTSSRKEYRYLNVRRLVLYYQVLIMGILFIQLYKYSTSTSNESAFETHWYFWFMILGSSIFHYTLTFEFGAFEMSYYVRINDVFRNDDNRLHLA